MGIHRTGLVKTWSLEHGLPCVPIIVASLVSIAPGNFVDRLWKPLYSHIGLS